MVKYVPKFRSKLNARTGDDQEAENSRSKLRIEKHPDQETELKAQIFGWFSVFLKIEVKNEEPISDFIQEQDQDLLLIVEVALVS